MLINKNNTNIPLKMSMKNECKRDSSFQVGRKSGFNNKIVLLPPSKIWNGAAVFHL